MNIFQNNNASGNYRPVASHDFSDDESEEDDFIQEHIRKQKLQMSRQDEGLELLAQSAERLGVMSTTITQELDYQNQMLDDIEEDLDATTDNLDLVTRKTREMIQKSGGKRNCIIIVALSGIVLLLVWLILVA
mmetsp:Transcript_37325/g.42655  ORF Transcript_37325/g.42655 Transcript_37325/m.42655 type:complete len:133 (+) Transcript_37325:150-548(+)|eukprot:CAMPEP_0194132784 /NCGR_PEP_ID=MMETSP0152-20130528/3181_1 /TAXON_ID=1049557 /ORGANISM="Thalassiothrix antarctica, Strain L6-D1" /LENGTH=132 /DNA_ID=CAMNT_0038827955 /DNA_START=151 /DNA_END=549 /DNA_ORIENTATION=+